MTSWAPAMPSTAARRARQRALGGPGGREFTVPRTCFICRPGLLVEPLDREIGRLPATFKHRDSINGSSTVLLLMHCGGPINTA